MHREDHYIPTSLAEIQQYSQWLDEALLTERTRKHPVVTPFQKAKNLANRGEEALIPFDDLSPRQKTIIKNILNKKRKTGGIVKISALRVPESVREKHFPRKVPGTIRRLQGAQFKMKGTDKIRDYLRAAEKECDKAAGVYGGRVTQAVDKFKSVSGRVVNTALGNGELSKDDASALQAESAKMLKAAMHGAASFGDARSEINHIADNQSPPWLVGPEGRKQRSAAFIRDTGTVMPKNRWPGRPRGKTDLSDRNVGALLKSVDGMLALVDPGKVHDDIAKIGIDISLFADGVDKAIEAGTEPDRSALAMLVAKFLMLRDEIDHEFTKMVAAIDKRVTEIMSRFKGRAMSVQVESSDCFDGVMSDLRALVEQSSDRMGCSATAHTMIRQQVLAGKRLDAVSALVDSLRSDFEDGPLDMIEDMVESVRESRSRRDAINLADVLDDLASELQEEGPGIDPRYAVIANSAACMLRDVFDYSNLGESNITEGARVTPMTSQSKSARKKRIKERIQTLLKMSDRIVDELGGGRRGADAVKRKIDAISKLKLDQDGANKVVTSAAKAMQIYMKRNKVLPGVRHHIMGQFLLIKKDLGISLHGLTTWAKRHLLFPAMATHAEFFEIGERPEGEEQPKKSVKTSGAMPATKGLEGLEAIGLLGLTPAQTKKIMQDPFGYK